MTTESAPQESDKNYTILLVEDDAPDIALTKNRVLDVWPNAVIIPVQSLGEAYKTYAQHDFNLVLLDLNLPDAYGAATVTEMRNFNKKVPIVVLTGMGNDLTVNNALKLGANHVALKSEMLGEDFKNILEQHVQEDA